MCAHPHVLRNALIRWQLHVIWLLLVQVSGEALKSRTQGDPTNIANCALIRAGLNYVVLAIEVGHLCDL